MFCCRDRDILQKCGQDAVQFLMFQRYLIMIMGLTMTLCIAIVLPINITYGQIGLIFSFLHLIIWVWSRVLLQFPGSGNPGNDPGSGKEFPGSNSRSK